MSSLSASSLLLATGALAGPRGCGCPGAGGGGLPGLILRVAAIRAVAARGRRQQRAFRHRREARVPAEEREEVAEAHDRVLLDDEIGGVDDPVEDQSAREEPAPPDRQQREEIGHRVRRGRRRVALDRLWGGYVAPGETDGAPPRRP